jgi:hypothetical protein
VRCNREWNEFQSECDPGSNACGGASDRTSHLGYASGESKSGSQHQSCCGSGEAGRSHTANGYTQNGRDQRNLETTGSRGETRSQGAGHNRASGEETDDNNRNHGHDRRLTTDI